MINKTKTNIKRKKIKNKENRKRRDNDSSAQVADWQTLQKRREEVTLRSTRPNIYFEPLNNENNDENILSLSEHYSSISENQKFKKEHYSKENKGKFRVINLEIPRKNPLNITNHHLNVVNEYAAYWDSIPALTFKNHYAADILYNGKPAVVYVYHDPNKVNKTFLVRAFYLTSTDPRVRGGKINTMQSFDQQICKLAYEYIRPYEEHVVNKTIHENFIKRVEALRSKVEETPYPLPENDSLLNDEHSIEKALQDTRLARKYSEELREELKNNTILEEYSKCLMEDNRFADE